MPRRLACNACHHVEAEEDNQPDSPLSRSRMRHSSRTPTCFLRPVSHRARKQRSTQPYEPYVEASHRKEDHREQASKSTLGERWPSVHWLQSRHACEGTEGEERGAHARSAKRALETRDLCVSTGTRVPVPVQYSICSCTVQTTVTCSVTSMRNTR